MEQLTERTELFDNLYKQRSDSLLNILLTYRNAIGFLQYEEMEEPTVESISLVYAFITNIASLGLTLSADAIMTMEKIPADILREELPLVLNALIKYRGADKKYEPFWPNFPYDVRVMDDCVLYCHALIHYLSGGKYYPPTPTISEETALNAGDDEKEGCPSIDPSYLYFLSKIDFIADTDTAVSEIAFNFMQANTSLGDQEMMVIDHYFKYIFKRYMFPYNVTTYVLLPEIPFKENTVKVMLSALQYAPRFSDSTLSQFKQMFHTATDVLRLYVGISGGDISLAKPTKLISLASDCKSGYDMFDQMTGRSKRKFFMNLLADVSRHSDIIQDMLRYPEFWKRVGERIHPSSFDNGQYRIVQDAFKIVRNKDSNHEESFNYKVDCCIRDGRFDELISLLKTRPGEFARRLDHILREAPDDETRDNVLTAFSDVATDVSPSILYQVCCHFRVRDKQTSVMRIVRIKGETRKSYICEPNTTPIPDKYTNAVGRICQVAIMALNMKKSFMGNVFIDDSINGFLMPSDQRASHRHMSRPVVHGSRFPIPDTCKTIRAYMWWTNPEDNERTDLDLSASMYLETGTSIKTLILEDRVYYITLRNEALGVYHSGDIVDGGDYNGNGATEFIDMDIEKLAKHSVRYVVLSINLFHGISIESMDGHLNAGWLCMPEEPSTITDKIRSVFDPSKLEMRFSITTACSWYCPFIVDTFDRSIIWMDQEWSPESFININNIDTNATAIAKNLYSTLYDKRLTIKDAAILNANARASHISTSSTENADEARANADYVFALSRLDTDTGKVITPFMMDELMTLI